MSKAENLLNVALKTKVTLDDLTLLGDKLYVCMECGNISDYFKVGEVCERCEYEAELQDAERRGK